MSIGLQSGANPFSQDPWPAPAAQRSHGCLIAFVVLLFLGIGGIPVGMYYLLSRVVAGGKVPEDVSPDQQSLRDESQQAFARNVPNVPPQDSTGIQALFRAVEQATRNKDHKAFLRLVDREALFGIQQKSVKSSPINPIQRSYFRWQLLDTVEVEEGWHQCRIMGVQPLGSPGWLRVYVYVDPEVQQITYRFTTVRRGAVWKIADWERLDLGLSKAEEWAIYETRAEDSRLDTYNRMCERMNRSDQLLEANDRAGAQRELRQCAWMIVPPELEDFVFLLVGYRWRNLGDESEALRWFQRVKVPDNMPGSWLGQAYSHEALGHHKQAFECAAKYEEAVGNDPNCSRLKAQFLARTRRRLEAMKEWQDVLRFAPEDLEALEGVAEALPADRLTELIQLVERASQPTELAEQLFFALQWSQPAASQAMAEFIQSRDPDSARALYVDGHVLNWEHDSAAAAQRFLQAAQKTTDKELRANYENAYLQAMDTLGRMLEGYQSASDSQAAFDYLVKLYEEEGTIRSEQLLLLTDANRQREPDDVMSDYYAGVAYTALRKYADAERVLRAGLARVKTNEDRERLEDQLVEVMYRGHRFMEAYRTLPPAKKRFQQVATRLTPDGRWSDLTELMDAHRAQHPDDVWLHYYSAEILRGKGQTREALDSFIVGLRHAGAAGDDAARFRNAIVELCIEIDDFENAYQYLDTEPNAFANFARRMIYGENWSSLTQWIALRRQHSPDDPAIWEWEAELRWGTKDYAGLAAHTGEGLLTNVKGLADYDRENWLDRLVRALLRSGRMADAERLARQIEEDSGNLLPRILVSAMAGRADETQRLIDEFRPTDDSVDDLYNDEDLGQLLWQPLYAEWRRRRPPMLPDLFAQAGTILLLRQPDTRTPDELRAAIASGLSGEFSLIPISSGARLDGQAFVIRADQMQFVIRRASEPDAISKQAENDLNDELQREACRQHQAWLAIAGLSDNWAGPGDLTTASYRVAQTLVNENCLALRFTDLNRLVLNNSDTMEALDAVAPQKQLGKLGTALEYYDEDQTSYGTPPGNDAYFQQLRSYHDAHLTRRPDQRFEVVVEMSAFPFEDQITLAIDSIHLSHGSYEVIASLIAKSPILPHCRAGDLFKVDEYQITEWRYTDGDELVTVRRPSQRDREE